MQVPHLPLKYELSELTIIVILCVGVMKPAEMTNAS